jgi:hypothetical protein
VPQYPIQPVTLDEAARILGLPRATASRLLHDADIRGDRYRHRRQARADVETLAFRVYQWRRHRHDLDPYWVTGARAAGILGINITRLNQLAVRGFVPFELHVDGTRLYRREQLAVVANARDVRWARYRWGRASGGSSGRVSVSTA